MHIGLAPGTAMTATGQLHRFNGVRGVSAIIPEAGILLLCGMGTAGQFPTSLLFRSDGWDGVISSIAVAGRSDVIARWRANYQKSAPAGFQSMPALHMATRKSGLPAELLDLVDYRVSQINACAFCLDMHSKDLRARGETEQRLYMVSAWRDAPNLYSPRERAALAWAEAVTRLDDQQVPDEVYKQARAEFGETELAQLTLAVISINGWNRLNIAFHTPAGNYVSNVKQSTA